MAVEVFDTPEGLEPPELDVKQPIDDYLKEQEEFVKKVQDWAKKNGRGRYRGKEVHWPQADGMARYVVLSLTPDPVQLIHLNIGDAWHFPYIERLTAQDILDKIEQIHKMDQLFRKGRQIKK